LKKFDWNFIQSSLLFLVFWRGDGRAKIHFVKVFLLFFFMVSLLMIATLFMVYYIARKFLSNVL
jgi:hypothetical protein